MEEMKKKEEERRGSYRGIGKPPTRLERAGLRFWDAVR